MAKQPTQKRKPTVRGRGTLEDCAKSATQPKTKIFNGHKFRWVGIGWVDEGPVKKSRIRINMSISIMLDILDACTEEPELRMAHRLLGQEAQKVAERSPTAMRPSDFIVCKFAFRYLCYSVMESKISH